MNLDNLLKLLFLHLSLSLPSLPFRLIQFFTYKSANDCLLNWHIFSWKHLYFLIEKAKISLNLYLVRY